MENVVIYSRVSTDQQDTDRQEYDIINFCNKNNLSIVAKYKEIISGLKKNEERKVLNEMMDFVLDPENKIDCVVITEISRIGRRLANVLQNVEKLTDARICVITTTNNIRTLNPDKSRNEYSFLILNIMGSIASMEREQTVQRSKSQIIKGILEHSHFSGGKYLPYGYSKKDKKLIINKEEAEVIKLIFNLYTNNFGGSKQIAVELNKRGIKTRRHKLGTTETINGIERTAESFVWKDSTIIAILQNELYYGNRKKDVKDDDGNIITHIIPSPAIITEEEFKKAAEIRDKNNYKKGINTKYKYLLNNNKFICGVCGKNFTASNRNLKWGKDDEKHVKESKYKCFSKVKYNGNGQTDGCESYSFGVEKIFSAIYYFLRRSDDLKKQLKKSIEKNDIIIEIQNNEKYLELLQNDIQKNEQKRKKLLQLFLDDLIQKIDYEAQFTATNIILSDLNNKLKLANDKIVKLYEMKKKQLSLNEMILNLKNDSDLMKKYMNDIVNHLVIYPVKVHTFRFTKSRMNDRYVVANMFLFNNDEPISFMISQRTNKILKLTKGEFNPKTFTLKGKDESFRIREKEIIHKIEIESIPLHSNRN